ncbi:MAG TPA: outer membrane beta-barrel protein [Bacteroidales bacterium]|nr:outer membrane beta-barrel protein [Bacteroidales bacterium]
MKKNSLTLLILLLVSATSFAQFNTGDAFAGGSTNLSAGFSSEKDKADNYTSEPTKKFQMSMNIKGGYFLKQRFAMGGLFNYSLNRSKYLNDKTISNSLMIGPVARYYRGIYQGISPFAEGLVAFGISKSKTIYTEGHVENKHTIFEAAAGVGANYFFKENIALEGLLQYAYLNQTPSGSNPVNNHHIKGGLNLLFGITVYFSSL